MACFRLWHSAYDMEVMIPVQIQYRSVYCDVNLSFLLLVIISSM